MISGAAIPTQRAFIMTGIVFAAILIDRLRLSMRICALAALVVLVLDPASLVGVSFQMSFGAVVALIAVYEKWGARLGPGAVAAKARKHSHEHNTTGGAWPFRPPGFGWRLSSK